MFNQPGFSMQTMSVSPKSGLTDRQALQAFERMRSSAKARALGTILTGQSRALQSLADLRETVKDRHYVGLRTVAIQHIRGTVDRADSFDIDFNPLTDHLKHRWAHIYRAMQQGEMLPPVELIQVGYALYVVDGHHRISAACALKQRDIEAIVTVWETE